LAKATGARVVKSPVEEIGWYHVQKCQLAKSDRLFDGFCEEVPVFQWHGDMFQVPLNGNLLATAEGCPNQALKIGDNAYGLQFHVEVTDKTIREWCEEYCETDLPGRLDHAQSMMDDYWKHKKVFDRQAKVLYQNFLKIIAAGGKD
jgi:GMP synthase-like glutamine amidotransferase